MSTTPLRIRNVAMKDSWSHGDGRRERGRVDRGVNRPRRSPSPPRRLGSEREGKARGRSEEKSKPLRSKDRQGDHSQERHRLDSRSPGRDFREDVRQRNRGRELLDTRISGKSRQSDHLDRASEKRHKSRSLSRDRTTRKRSWRAGSRSPARVNLETSASRHRPRDSSHSRHRSPSHKTSSIHTSNHIKERRASNIVERRRHSPPPRRDRPASRGRDISPRPAAGHRKRSRSPDRVLDRRRSSRRRSPHATSSDTGRRRIHSHSPRRRSPEGDRFARSGRRRLEDSPPPKDSRDSRPTSPARGIVGHSVRDEYRPGSRSTKETPKASGANSIEVNMAGRGNFSHQPGYHNPNQQMQAAFPLKPQFSPGPRAPVDNRQYSHSPQHMTPNSSYHGSPHVQSPYAANRGGWGGQQQQFSPQQ